MLRLRAPLHLHCSNHQQAGEKKTGHRGTCSSLALVIGRALCTCTSHASKDQFSLLSTLLFILLDAAFRHPSRCSDSPLCTVYPSLLALVLASLVNFLSSVFDLPHLFYITCFFFLSDFLTFCSLGISQSSQSLFLIS